MNKKLNVIVLGGFNYPAGMAGTKRVQLFIDYLRAQNAALNIITLGNTGDAAKGNAAAGVYKNVRYRNIGASLSSAIIFYILYPFIFLYVCLLLIGSKKSGSKNVMYVYNSVTIENFLVLLFAKLIGYKIILDIVEDYCLSLENNNFLHSLKLKSTIFFEKRVTVFCNAIVVLSSYLEQLYKKRVNGKIPVVNIPVSTLIKNKSESTKSKEEIIKVCYSGSFGNKDGLNTLIEAFNIFNKKFPDSELLLSGMGNNSKKIVADANHEKVKYAGYLNEKEYENFINNADILCMTRVGTQYANAGFPFKLGEYLASGKPVITTNVSDVSLYLKNYEDCIIVQPENVQEVADALIFFAENREQAIAIGKSGKLAAEKYFNSEVNSEKLVSLMEQV